MKQNIVVIGAGGRLGAALMRAYRNQFNVAGFDHAQLELGNLEQVRATLEPMQFDLLINCAAQTNVDRCETHREEAFVLNAEAPRVLAEICQARGAKMIHISTDYVFDGNKPEPYTEEDPAEPISVYGESKREGERRVLATSDRHLVLRVSWIFGPERPSFVDQMLQLAREKESVAAVSDKFSTPTYTRDITEMLPAFFSASSASGILHFANAGACSWQEYTQWAIDCAHAIGVPLRARTVGSLSMRDMKQWLARRPVHTVLATEKYVRITGKTPRHWRDAVAEYVIQFYSKL